MKNRTTSVWPFLFWFYFITLLLIVVIKFTGSFTVLIDRIHTYYNNRLNGNWNFNLIPFHSIAIQWKYRQHGWASMNILGNFIPFLPFGFLLPLAYPKHRTFWKLCVTSFLTILGIELFQFFTMLGSFDVDDIILNLIGIITGYLIYLFCQKLITGKKIS